MFLELDVKVYFSFDRFSTAGFKFNSLRASLLTVLRVVYAIVRLSSGRWWNRELTLKCKLKCYVKPMKDPLGVTALVKGIREPHEVKKKFFFSFGIEPTTSGLIDLPLLCRLSYEVGQRKYP